MHAARTPPRPNLFGHKRQERREEPQKRIQSGGESRQHRSLLGLATSAVGAVFNEFHEIIGERPEETLCNLEGTSVFVFLESCSCFLNEVCQTHKQGAIQRVGKHLPLRLRGNHRFLSSTQIQHEL